MKDDNNKLPEGVLEPFPPQEEKRTDEISEKSDID